MVKRLKVKGALRGIGKAFSEKPLTFNRSPFIKHSTLNIQQCYLTTKTLSIQKYLGVFTPKLPLSDESK